MKTIAGILENYFKQKKLEGQNLKKIKKDFYLDLNELDYKKYWDSFPENPYIFISLLRRIASIWFMGFLFYVICDFMNYSIIIELLIKPLYTFYQVSLVFLFIGFFIDLIQVISIDRNVNKHKLLFYNRLKKYKK